MPIYEGPFYVPAITPAQKRLRQVVRRAQEEREKPPPVNPFGSTPFAAQLEAGGQLRPPTSAQERFAAGLGAGLKTAVEGAGLFGTQRQLEAQRKVGGAVLETAGKVLEPPTSLFRGAYPIAERTITVPSATKWPTDPEGRRAFEEAAKRGEIPQEGFEFRDAQREVLQPLIRGEAGVGETVKRLLELGRATTGLEALVADFYNPIFWVSTYAVPLRLARPLAAEVARLAPLAGKAATKVVSQAAVRVPVRRVQEAGLRLATGKPGVAGASEEAIPKPPSPAAEPLAAEGAPGGTIAPGAGAPTAPVPAAGQVPPPPAPAAPAAQVPARPSPGVARPGGRIHTLQQQPAAQAPAAQAAQVPSARVPLMITREQRQALLDSGLTKAQIDTLTPQQAQDILGSRVAAPSPAAPAAAGAAAPPPVKPPAIVPTPRPAKLRLAIRQTEREGGGFLISGRDTKGRQVRVFADTLEDAKRVRENIRQGLEPRPGTAAEAQARNLAKAERRYRAALKKGEPGATQRALVELQQAQAAAPPGGAPPKLPPTVGPGGGITPAPDFNSARDKLLRILGGAVRKTKGEIETLRAQEMSRRAGRALSATESALAQGRSPLPGIRAAQKGELPVGELQLSDRLTTGEAAVLRDRIYQQLGPDLNFTSANIEEALTRLAMDGKVPTDSELAWMAEIYGPELIEALRGLRTQGAKVRETLLEAWNLPRTLIASMDDSMVLRQGLHLLPEGAPAARALAAHVKAITKAGSAEVNEIIRANPWYNHGRAHGLDLTLPNLRPGLAGREEVFMGAGLARKIPVLGKGVEISERVATAYLNKLRMETYAAHAAELKRMGAGFDAFKELAENINILSGRASLGRAQPIAPILNGMFFSARLNWAAMQRPFRILRQVPNLNTEEGRHLAKMLARDVYGVWAAIGGMLGLAAAAGVAKVELDPRSSDFGKAQVGTVRVDPWAGQQQFAVLMARIISGSRKTTTTRQLVPADSVDTLGRFLESKFHPALGQLITVKEGKTYIGEDLTVAEYAKLWLPLFIQDLEEVVSGTSPGIAGALGTLAFFGVSVYNIPGVPATVLDQFQEALDAYNAIPTDPLKLGKGQLSRENYRIKSPETDVALFLAGQVSSLETRTAVDQVAALVKQHGINPEHIRGVQERKERLQEASLAGVRLERTLVDVLIGRLEEGTPVSAPAPTPTPAPLAAPTPTPAPQRVPVRRKATPVPVGAGR